MIVKVAVVILNWNGKNLLEEFLPFLIRYTPFEFDLYIGDNASNDDSISFIQSHYPQIKIIQNPINLGFAGGYNRILEEIESQYLVLLNSDVEVTENWLEPVIQYLDNHPETVAAQPKIRSYFQRDYFEYAGAAGGFMDNLGYFFCRGRIFDTLEKDIGQYNDYQNVFWASGAAFFIRTIEFKKAGGFDASLFAHMEEIDLCWRLQRKGFKIAYVPDSMVYHMGGQTLQLQNSQKTFLNFRNNLIILYKNLPPESRLKTLMGRFGLDFIAWLNFLAHFRWQHAWAVNKAHIDFLRLVSGYECQKNKPKEPVNNLNYTNNLSGFFNHGIVWNYYILKKKYFSQLNFKPGNPSIKKASIARG
jgi:GT2 family glycosyltransferase